MPAYHEGMPSRNSIKHYDTDTYYHIYNRGVNKRRIFIDDEDYVVFMGLLKRYLGNVTEKDSYNRGYPNFFSDLDLIAFCLMPNHFHLLVYQKDNPRAIESLLRCIATTYTSYFNKKYRRVGHLFQGAYKASRVSSEPYLLHISRYIHMNPEDYKNWPYSSWPYFTKGWSADWVKQHRVFELFEGGDYERFVDNYQEIKGEIDSLKVQLADN